EARSAVRCPPRPGASPQGARPGENDRGRRLLCGVAERTHLRALSRGGRGLRPWVDLTPRGLGRRGWRGHCPREVRRVAGVRGRPAWPARAAISGVGADLDGLQLEV